MAQAPHEADKAHEKEKAKAPAELSATLPPMVLEQHESGMWMYSRPAWVGGPAIEPNGAGINITDRAQAERVINNIHPGSFPDRDAEDAKDAEKAQAERKAATEKK